MTHTLEGREAPQAAAMGVIRSSSGAPEAVHLRRARTIGDRPSGHEAGPTPGGDQTPRGSDADACQSRPGRAVLGGKISRTNRGQTIKKA